MTLDSRLLHQLLRFQLDATHQQFMHVLALRQWQDHDAAARITALDDIDFPGAMRIIDHLVAQQIPVTLTPANFSPGQDYATILRAEQELEKRFEIVAAGRAESVTAQRLVDAARAPRQAYAHWLARQIEQHPSAHYDRPAIASELQELVAHLVTMIEQSMIHAFVEWHANQRQAADAAWATSGAAMMQLTRLVALFARIPGVPVPGDCPAPRVSETAGSTLALDQSFALACEQQARLASERCADDTIGACCTDIADYYRALANWTATREHPAAATNPSAFASFAATLERFVA